MNNINVSKELFSNYSSSLIDRVFKILPLFEEKNEGLYKYVQSLIYELNGIFYVVDKLKYNAEYLILLATLESLSDDVMFSDVKSDVIKREVFKCIDIIKRVEKTTYESGE
jgi:hypothetical protein